MFWGYHNCNNNTHTHTNRDAMFHEYSGGEDGGEMVHEVRVALKQLWCLLLHRGLKTLCICWGHPVPGLGLSPGMYVLCVCVREREREKEREEGGGGGREIERERGHAYSCVCAFCVYNLIVM